MITEITMWQVEGFSEPFPTKEIAELNLATRNLADWLEARSPISEDDAWNLATKLKEEFCMIPRSKAPVDLLTEFVETTQLYMNSESTILLEHIKNVY